MATSLSVWLPVHDNGDVDWNALDIGEDELTGEERPTKKLASGWHWELFVIQQAPGGE